MYDSEQEKFKKAASMLNAQAQQGKQPQRGTFGGTKRILDDATNQTNSTTASTAKANRNHSIPKDKKNPGSVRGPVNSGGMITNK